MKRRTKLFRLFCLIGLGVVVGGVVIGSVNDNVDALSYRNSVGVGFTFNPTLSVTLSGADLTINNLAPGVGAGDSNIITVGVSTNVVEGYKLSATVGNTLNATTSLVNGDNSFAALSSSVGGLSEFSNNTWGYSYCAANCDTANNWVSGSQGSAIKGYAGLPLYTDVGVQLASANNSASSSVQFKMAAMASSTQPSGEYTNTINFTAVSNVVPMSLLDAFVASDATMQNGYYTMQGMTSAICDAATIGSSMQLLDIRDNKLYWVAKLADNNCWMTQNLDLDLVAGSTSLTSNNTDLSTNENIYTAANTIYALKGVGDTYGYTYENGIATWIPERTTIAYNQLDSTNWQNSNTDPYSWDRLETSGANVGQPVHPDSNVADEHGLAGNYYNWTASLASNDSASATGDPTNSICPKGWRLPNVTNQEFSNLLVQYNIISTNTSNSYIENASSVNSMGASPLYFVRGGGVYGGSLSDSGDYGYYWYSTSNISSLAYYLSYNSSSVNSQNSNDRSLGHSIRCLARSE